MPDSELEIVLSEDGGASTHWWTEETAEILNLSNGAVKARLFRARLRLREDLSKILKRG